MKIYNKIKTDYNSGITEGDSRYMASELLQNNVSSSVDIFSLGMSLIEAIFDINLPVDGELWHKLRQGILPDENKNINLTNDIEIQYSKELINCVKQMIHIDPLLRPTPDQIFKWKKLYKVKL